MQVPKRRIFSNLFCQVRIMSLTVDLYDYLVVDNDVDLTLGDELLFFVGEGRGGLLICFILFFVLFLLLVFNMFFVCVAQVGKGLPDL